MSADKPAGTTAYGQWQKVNTTPDYTTSFIISSDGLGHYAIKQIWTDDYLEFIIPVKDFAAGSAVNIRFAMSGVATAPRYWAVEYFDHGTWKFTSSQEYTYSNNGSLVTATYEITKANGVVDVSETARFTEAVDNGSIRFRIRCADGGCKIDGKAPLTKPASAEQSVSVRGQRQPRCHFVLSGRLKPLREGCRPYIPRTAGSSPQPFLTTYLNNPISIWKTSISNRLQHRSTGSAA